MKTFKALILILIAATLAACSGGLGEVYAELSKELEPVRVLNLRAEAGDGTVALSWENNPRFEREGYTWTRHSIINMESGAEVYTADLPLSGEAYETKKYSFATPFSNGVAYQFSVYLGKEGSAEPDPETLSRIVFTPAIYVRKGSVPVGDAPLGSNWENAFNNLGDALALASERYPVWTNEQHIWVASGFYYPSDSGDTTFTVNCPVWIKGSMAGTEVADNSKVGIPAERINRWYGSGPTMLSGMLFDDNGAPTSLNAAHVMTIDGGGAVHLETLGIQDGGDAQLGNGGGIYADGSMDLFLRLADCRVADNAAAGNGGGIYVRSTGASVWLEAVATQFDGNTADVSGGAVYIETDGAVASRFVRCKFLDNKAETGSGGAIYCSGAVDHIVSSVFAANTCGAYGGALYLDNPGGGNKTVTVANCTLYDNSAGRGGAVYLQGLSGSIYSLDIFNTIMTRCTASVVEGGDFVFAQNNAELRYVGFLSTGTAEANFGNDDLYSLTGVMPQYWEFILTTESIAFDKNHRPLNINSYREQGVLICDFSGDASGGITLYDSNYGWPYDRFDVNGGWRISGSTIDIGAVEYQE